MMLTPDMSMNVAVIDEIQMLRDDQRGYAFTRALLAVKSQEVGLRRLIVQSNDSALHILISHRFTFVERRRL